MDRVILSFGDPKYTDQELCDSISEILSDNYLLSAATNSGRTSYINTAYFCYNSKLDVFFLSEPTAEHSKNLLGNPSVAAAVYNSAQPWDDPKRGLQLFGTAAVTTGDTQREAFDLYMKRFKGLSEWVKRPEDLDTGVLESKFYKLKVNRIKIFDEVKFGMETYITLLKRT